MKKRLTILTVCLALIGINASFDAPASDENSRVSKRNTTNVSANNSTTRTTSTGRSAQTNNNIVSRSATTSAVSNRLQPAVVNRDTTTNPTTTSRSAVTKSTISARTATANKINTRTPAATISRSATTSTAVRSAVPTANISRSATLTADEIINKQGSYSKCRDTFYDCMDEFCANKDAQLKRCACSARHNEFDQIQERMNLIEKEMLEFNERLLTVNMDKEDALAISQATEGELAFATEDDSESKGILAEIADKLNKETSQTQTENSLAAISLSLNVDSAFDSIDFMMGSDTVLKEGVDLYNAALPVCLDIANEICDAESIELIQSGYQMSIEQDCNTVAKAFDNMQTQAAAQIHEGSALLDMSRLNTYQTKNSDDILTCKKKMLEMMYSTSVCGDDLSKCLDITGQYIDPTTGGAFLSSNLSNLANLITRPAGDLDWSDVPGNLSFVTHLESKKKYLEPAMENCQDVSSLVWEDFIEDALGQIKLAQDAKIEEMRQSCTKLTSQCLIDSNEDIADFDARALSIFGVWSDKTANEMCSEIRTSCTALLNNTGGGNDTWVDGIDGISLEQTYLAVLQTCTQVGKSCMTQACESISGNFGLCESVSSENRHDILQQDLCWAEVNECIETAGIDKITEIYNTYSVNQTFYNELYDAGATPYSACEVAEVDPTDESAMALCRIAEKIWGNCDDDPTETTLTENKILTPKDDTETLMSWFATNTNTAGATDSCVVIPCPPGFSYDEDTDRCIPNSALSSTEELCGMLINIYPDSNEPDGYWTNCCLAKDKFGNCCTRPGGDICIPTTAETPSQTVIDGYTTYQLYCIPQDGITTAIPVDNISNGHATCNGKYVLISNDGIYTNAEYNKISTNGISPKKDAIHYYEGPSGECGYTHTANDPTSKSGVGCQSSITNSLIKYSGD